MSFFDANTNAGVCKGHWTTHTWLIAGLPGLELDEGPWSVTKYDRIPVRAGARAAGVLTTDPHDHRHCSNPQWETQELQLQRQINNVISAGNAALPDILAYHQQDRAQTMDRVYGHLTHSISGQVLVPDPATCDKGVVADQGYYYWRIRGSD